MKNNYIERLNKLKNMGNYQPTFEDIEFAKNVYENIVKQQILQPEITKKAFEKLYGYKPLNLQNAKLMLTTYFTYHYKKVDVPVNTEDSQNDSHTEDGNDTVPTTEPVENPNLSTEMKEKFEEVNEKIDKRTKEYKEKLKQLEGESNDGTID